MSEHDPAADVRRGLKVVIGVLVALVILAIAVLVVVALTSRVAPGIHFPFVASPSTAASGNPPTLIS